MLKQKCPFASQEVLNGGSSSRPTRSLWPGVSLEEVQVLREAALLTCSSSVVWLPEYGCAVVKLSGASSSIPKGDHSSSGL